MFVRPAEGRAVRDPDTRVLLSAEGEEKPDTRFWRRRLRDADVEEAAKPADPDAPPAVPDRAIDAQPPAEEH